MTDISAGIEIPVPEPELTPGDMLARATGLRELLRAGAAGHGGARPCEPRDPARVPRRGLLPHAAAAPLRRLRVRRGELVPRRHGGRSRLRVLGLGPRAHRRAPHAARRAVRRAHAGGVLRPRRGLPRAVARGGHRQGDTGRGRLARGGDLGLLLGRAAQHALPAGGPAARRPAHAGLRRRAARGLRDPRRLERDARPARQRVELDPRGLRGARGLGHRHEPHGARVAGRPAARLGDPRQRDVLGPRRRVLRPRAHLDLRRPGEGGARRVRVDHHHAGRRSRRRSCRAPPPGVPAGLRPGHRADRRGARARC